MKALKLTLQGKTAFFKKPDVNTYIYFTYSNIHKVALLGVIGAVLGLPGYNSQNGADYPEFYSVLKDLKVAIVPKNQKDEDHGFSMIAKKVQVFNNSVGYASKEAGGNLIIKEQWLENPNWEIYIMEGHALFESLKQRFLDSQYIYIPYLGKNDHLASINNVEEVDIEPTKEASKVGSLFLKQFFENVDEEQNFFSDDYETYYKYEEKLPVGLDQYQNQYEVANFIMTNKKMKPINDAVLYRYKDKVLYFF